MYKYRAPRWFMRLVGIAGSGAVAFSLSRTPVSKMGAPLLLLLLLAFLTGSRYSIPMPRGRGQVSILNTFCLLVVLLFGGDAAVAFAAATALCLSLGQGREKTVVFFDASISGLSTLLLVWTIRLNFGTILEPGTTAYSRNFFEALLLAALIQASLSAAQILINEAYLIKESIWRKWGAIGLWTSLASLAGTITAGLGAWLIAAMGNTTFLVVGLLSFLSFLTYKKYHKSLEPLSAPPEHFGTVVRDSSDRFRSAFDNAAIGMALVTPEGRWLQVNHSLCRLLGYSERELMAIDYLKVLHPNDLSPALANFKDLLRGRIPACQMEKRYIHKSGEEVWGLWSASLAQDAHARTPNLIFQIQDITIRKQAEEKLHHDAFHDALTGLPNRALFTDHVKLAIARLHRRGDQRFAVLYLDLDRFKVINDSLGHLGGDQLLIGIARRLENCLRPGDTIARIGGDEFTVLLEDIGDGSEVAQIAERIQNEISAPFNLSGREVFTTVSMGIALSSQEYERPEDILRDADTAMYRAKGLGKARHETFDTGMHSQAIKLLQLETDLRRAVERREFFVVYQPIMSLASESLRGFEALVRWHHPIRGLISPMEFIPVAEETGMIVQIGEWVLREACTVMQRWQQIYPSDPRIFVCVNLSVKQFSQQDLIEKVSVILRETKLPAASLKLEITESAVMENVETATRMLTELRELGVQLAMDDFGTGYSSLSNLHRFPINTLKIDRSFITHMVENNENAEIVRTISGLAHNLGMDVVAEGVETREQLEILRGLGCQFGQGYFFSKPIDSKGAEDFISGSYSPNLQLLQNMSVDAREMAISHARRNDKTPSVAYARVV
ncbi:MAG TPA: EAL domain-containing protein [Pyrinomonadaceae bacterium]|nr:EAL domain-containing protein [Pyrinomonadaceae bacterium]